MVVLLTQNQLADAEALQLSARCQETQLEPLAIVTIATLMFKQGIARKYNCSLFKGQNR